MSERTYSFRFAHDIFPVIRPYLYSPEIALFSRSLLLPPPLAYLFPRRPLRNLDAGQVVHVIHSRNSSSLSCRTFVAKARRGSFEQKISRWNCTLI